MDIKPNKRMRIDGGLPTIGWGPFRYQWYSICSGHYNFDADCDRCIAGSWSNCWAHKVGHFVYENEPEVWRWWVNRPSLTEAGRKLFMKLFIK